MHDPQHHQRGLRLLERLQDLVREREEVPRSHSARALEQLSDGLQRRFLPIGGIAILLAVVEKEDVVRDGVALQEEVVVVLESFGVQREAELSGGRIRRRAEHDQAIDHFVVEEVADRQVPAEHVLAEDAAVSAEPQTFRIERDLSVPAEVTDYVAGRADLLEEEPAIDVGTRHDGEILDLLPDESLMDDGPDHAWRLCPVQSAEGR